MKLTAIIIAKNEEQMIADCMDTLSFCSEIILIDGGSTDRTVELAKHLGARVVSDTSKSFAERRNKGLKEAKGEWILYIDADERVSKQLAGAIEDAISEKENRFSAYRVRRKNFYLGNHEWPYIEKLERLFKREKLKKWHGTLHESAEVIGSVGTLEGYLLHYTHRDLYSMLDKTISWSGIEAETRFSANHPKISWWRFPRVMVPAFFQSFIGQKGYKAGTAGLIESMYQVYSIFITYARLWEMQESEKRK